MADTLRNSTIRGAWSDTPQGRAGRHLAEALDRALERGDLKTAAVAADHGYRITGDTQFDAVAKTIRTVLVEE